MTQSQKALTAVFEIVHAENVTLPPFNLGVELL